MKLFNDKSAPIDSLEQMMQLFLDMIDTRCLHIIEKAFIHGAEYCLHTVKHPLIFTQIQEQKV